MSYEAILPEISSRSAHFDLSGAIPGYNISSPSCRVIRVSGRYNVFNAFKDKDMQGFELPYWEEGAQKAEGSIKKTAVAFVFGLVLLTGLVIGRQGGKSRAKSVRETDGQPFSGTSFTL